MSCDGTPLLHVLMVAAKFDLSAPHFFVQKENNLKSLVQFPEKIVYTSHKYFCYYTSHDCYHLSACHIRSYPAQDIYPSEMNQ